MNLDNIKTKINKYNGYIDGWEEMMRASVAILLVENNEELSIIFEVRGKNLREQPGDVCFPGGKIDNGETPEEAVIREIKEELGLCNDDIEIIKELDTLIRYNGLIIHPFLGVIKNSKNIKLNKDEVQEVFYVPVDYLLKSEPIKVTNLVKVERAEDFPYDLIVQGKNYKFRDGKYESIFYKYNNYVIWGITAQMLKSFLNIIK